jgi:16S rRNA (uracil1498-N3)-methyltransferase
VVEAIASTEMPAQITLLAALFKFDRFEWMVEKATELGVECIVPVEAVRTEKGLFEASRKRAERWRRIAREASQQSRRTRMPEIEPGVKFDRAIGRQANFRYFLDEKEATPILAVLPQTRASDASIAVLLGPEGGWTDAERESARPAGWIPVSLGPAVLRAETAAAAALAILANAWMV